MKRRFPPIYPITDTVLSGLSHLEQVKLLIEAGAEIVQLREKNAASDDFFAAAVDAVIHAAEHGVKILINDRADIALAAGAAGVHVGQDDLPPAAVRQFLGKDALIGFSTHTLEQAADSARLPVDYIAFGPIFPTGTKADTDPVVGLALLGEVRSIVGDIPLVAIGGINRGNARSVFEAGADSLAIISDLTAEPVAIIDRFAELTRIADDFFGGVY